MFDVSDFPLAVITSFESFVVRHQLRSRSSPKIIIIFRRIANRELITVNHGL